jgi:hypothetical protein
MKMNFGVSVSALWVGSVPVSRARVPRLAESRIVAAIYFGEGV